MYFDSLSLFFHSLPFNVSLPPSLPQDMELPPPVCVIGPDQFHPMIAGGERPSEGSLFSLTHPGIFHHPYQQQQQQQRYLRSMGSSSDEEDDLAFEPVRNLMSAFENLTDSEEEEEGEGEEIHDDDKVQQKALRHSRTRDD